MKKIRYKIDGENFSDFAGFIAEVNQGISVYSGKLLVPGDWNGNLDALSDFPWVDDEGCVIDWINSAKSRSDLGHGAMAAWLANNLTYCHPSNRSGVQQRLDAANADEGQTLFELLVEIIEENARFIDLELK